MSEMVERVTAAIEGVIEARGGLLGKGSAELAVRAAIEAMRKPTPEMLRACWPLYHPWGQNAPPPEERPNNFADMTEKAEAYWQTMIDMALT